MLKSAGGGAAWQTAGAAADLMAGGADGSAGVNRGSWEREHGGG